MEVLHPKVLVEPWVRRRRFFEKPKNANNVEGLAALLAGEEVPGVVPRAALAVLAEHRVEVSVEEEEVEGVVARPNNNRRLEDNKVDLVVVAEVSRVVADLEEDRVLVVVAFRAEDRHHCRGLVDLHLLLLPGMVLPVSMDHPGDDAICYNM